jgi:hypothetical protein
VLTKNSNCYGGGDREKDSKMIKMGHRGRKSTGMVRVDILCLKFHERFLNSYSWERKLTATDGEDERRDGDGLGSSPTE